MGSSTTATATTTTQPTTTMTSHPSTTDQEEQERRHANTLRLSMIVLNNLSEIHRVVGNPSKYRLCMDRLLSSILYVTDRGLVDTLFDDPNDFEGFAKNVTPIVLPPMGIQRWLLSKFMMINSSTQN